MPRRLGHQLLAKRTQSPCRDSLTRPYGRVWAVVAIGLTTVLPGCAGDAPGMETGCQTTIMVGVDGMRWDYPEKFDLPTFQDIRKRGVYADHLVPIFPTKTFPNFYTLATGLFANHTGILDNTMYDPVMDSRFRMSDSNAVRDERWWQGEPIWSTAERQGCRAAAQFWPGTEAEVAGYRPSYWKAYDGSVTNDQRVEQVLAWLGQADSTRPGLIMMYFSSIDETAHRMGPDAPETAAAARSIDKQVAKLLNGIDRLGKTNETNVVIVSDHGLATTTGDQTIYLDELVDLDLAKPVSTGEHVTLWPKPEDVDDVYLALAEAHPALTVYKRDDLPARFHLSGHRRTPPIVAVPAIGWSVRRSRNPDRPPRAVGGAHGYDNADRRMHGVFMAVGPAFRAGAHVDSLRSVDVYDIVASALSLEPAPNDGDPSAIPHLMIQPQH